MDNFLVNDLPACVYWLDTEAQILSCNKRFLDINNQKTSSSIIGKKITNLPFFNDRPPKEFLF